jgi:hypothetical protein
MTQLDLPLDEPELDDLVRRLAYALTHRSDGMPHPRPQWSEQDEIDRATRAAEDAADD